MSPPKSIALAGFSTITLPGLKSAEVDEIWTLNHAFKMEWAFPRFDRLFELHEYGWFLRKGQYRIKEYENWLRRKHPFPIYMQKKYKSFPSSVRYPIEDVNELVFGKLLRDGQPNLYYTSSFGYMLGLAILEGIPRVEIYGIDMTNDTEWNYQKPAAEFMIGVALGHGMEVVLHPDAHLCKAQQYGYDKVPAADRKRAEDLMALYEKEHARYHKEAEALVEVVNNGRREEDQQEYMRVGALEAMYYGGKAVLEELLKGDDYYFGRQHLEDERHKYREKEEQYLALTNQKEAQYSTYRVLDTNGQSGITFKEYLRTRWSMYAHSGAKQALQKLIDECDMRVVSDELRFEIKDS